MPFLHESNQSSRRQQLSSLFSGSLRIQTSGNTFILDMLGVSVDAYVSASAKTPIAMYCMNIAISWISAYDKRITNVHLQYV